MDSASPPSQIGSYRIVRLIAEGGMGAVYEAILEPLGRRVALKVLLPEHAHNKEVVARFFNEARAVNLIEHPGIVAVSEFGQAPDGTAYLVMEYLRGESLTSRLSRLHEAGKRMPVAAALQIMIQMADALTAAHEKGIVHRDMKPSNVLLVRDAAVQGGERAKILDFGIAKLTESKGRGKATATNVVMGTPQYMSPEQCRGAGDVDERTDVYALGVMFYEMLAGRTPFLGEGSGDFIGQHMFMEPPQLLDLSPQVPAEVAALCHRLLIKDKTARPAMPDVGQELAKVLSRLSDATVIYTSGSLPLPEDLPKASGGVLAGPASTLGRSLGQTLRSDRTSRRVALIGAAIIASMMGIIFLSTRSGTKLAPAPTRPAAAQQVPLQPPPDSVRPEPKLPPIIPSGTGSGRMEKNKITDKSKPAVPPSLKPAVPPSLKPASVAKPAVAKPIPSPPVFKHRVRVED